MAIYSKLDVRVPAVQSAGVMGGTLGRLNHMQPAATGGLEGYGQIETTIAPEVLELIVNWLLERFM